MKATLTLLLILLSAAMMSAQTKLMGAYKNGSRVMYGVIDLVTKTQTDIDTLNGVSALVQGETTFDPVNRLYYCGTNIGILGVDSTGNIVTSLPASPLLNIQYDGNSNRLIGTRYAGSKVLFSTQSLSSGAITDLDTIRSTTSQGESALDPYNNLFYVLTNIGVLKIDVATGHTIDTLSGDINSIEYDAVSDKLLGLRRTTGKKVFFSTIDPNTKTQTDYDSVRGATTLVFSESSYDPTSRTYYAEASNDNVLIVDVATGTVIDTINRPQYFLGCYEINYHLPSLALSLQPQNQMVTAGSSVQFSVATSSPSPSYQWQALGSTGFHNITNGGQYNNTTTATLNVVNTSISDDHQKFRCLVSSAGATIPSRFANLRVNSNGGVAVKGVTTNNTITVSPNPTIDHIIIHAEDGGRGAPYIVCGQNGTIIMKGILQGKQTIVDLSKLPSAVYQLNISGGENRSFKVVKQ